MALPALPPLLTSPMLTAPPLALAVATPPLPADAVNCPNSSSLMTVAPPALPAAVGRVLVARPLARGRTMTIAAGRGVARSKPAQPEGQIGNTAFARIASSEAQC